MATDQTTAECITSDEAATIANEARRLTLEEVERLLSGHDIFHLPARMRCGLGEPTCADGDPPGAGWCQNAVDLVADTRFRAVNAIRVLNGKEPHVDDDC